MPYSLLEVTDRRTERRWLDVPRRLHAQAPNFIPFLDSELKGIFNPKQNPFYQHGDAIRWVLVDDKGQDVGRLAAFVNEKKAYTFPQPTGGCGFFECIDDQQAANTLFDAAKAWLRQRGMEAMDGPINFGENDRFWGLLVEGDAPPAYGTPYNPAYYQRLFWDYGFRLYFAQSVRMIDDIPNLPERFKKISDRVLARPDVEVAFYDAKNRDRYRDALLTIYNDAWRFHENFTPLTAQQLDKLIDELQPIMVPELIVFAFVDGKPGAFTVAFPDLNQVFRHANGRLSLWDKLLFLWRRRNHYAWYRKRGLLNQCRVTIMGVHTAYQRQGLDAALYVYGLNNAHRLGFPNVEINWVGDFNPKMQAGIAALGARPHKTFHTYRLLFDQPGVEQRSPFIDADAAVRN